MYYVNKLTFYVKFKTYFTLGFYFSSLRASNENSKYYVLYANLVYNNIKLLD